jgi:uncharacterized protein YjbI with pentapeptide repeats
MNDINSTDITSTNNKINTANNVFHGQNFNGLQFFQKRISHNEFYDCCFTSCDFNEAIFLNCEFNNCTFIACTLNNLAVNNSKFSDVTFTDCKMIGVNWTNAYWRGLMLFAPLTFKRSMINSSSFYGLNLAQIVIEGCRSHDVDFRECNLRAVNFSQSDLQNSLFNNTNLTDANFAEAKNYDINIRNNIVKNASFCRYEAISLLSSLDINLID